jgi:hypothetical protein
MTESGFKHFIQFMQERNAPPKPKRAPRPPILSDGPPKPPSPEEDYTGSVCLLHNLTPKTPAYEEVLVDVEDFEWLQHHSWRIDRWGRNKEKYAVNKSAVQLAVFIVKPPPGMIAEHISRRPLDNRRSNLRIGTPRQNVINTRRQKNGTSRFKGVQLCPKTGKWRVQCGPRKKRVFLGTFVNEVEAARVYNAYAKREYGEFACLNDV